ncbi:hypothetical protein FRC14_006406 [Serendipita sp. 396]|nr:hypothetical protein FRC14_006406 [Serendipita sp. 396]KAG8778921.1 hypothetical protein FRC15_010483 [Serendipita sp. 397]
MGGSIGENAELWASDRLCDIWNEIVKRQAGTDSISGSLEDLSNSTLAHSARRVEVMNSTETCCRKWPCHFSCQQGTPKYNSPPYREKYANEIQYQGKSLSNAQVIRILENLSNPSSLMRNCINLEALWIHFHGFKALFKTPEITNRIQKQVTHLHLHKIHDDGDVYALHLPSLVYLRLNMYLREDDCGYPYVFPLDIHMPKISTIYLEAYQIAPDYAPSIQRMIMSCRSTLVNLLISYCRKPWEIFPLENLSQLPKLSKLGWSIDNFVFFDSFPDDLFIAPPLTSSPLSLVLLGIDYERFVYHRSHFASACVSMLSRSTSWLSKVVIPFKWNELEELWTFACETFTFNIFNSDDPLPCAWSILDCIYRSGIMIEDRNGVDLRSEAGQKLANRMRRYAESKDYLRKMRKRERKTPRTRGSCVQRSWNRSNYRFAKYSEE